MKGTTSVPFLLLDPLEDPAYYNAKQERPEQPNQERRNCNEDHLPIFGNGDEGIDALHLFSSFACNVFSKSGRR